MGDRRKCQTYTASPAEPGGLPVMLAGVDFGNGMPSPNEPLRCRFSGIQKLGNGGDQLSCRNLTSRQIDQRGRISAIRSMNHVDAISALNNSPAT